jgi:hypothetical protein
MLHDVAVVKACIVMYSKHSVGLIMSIQVRFMGMAFGGKELVFEEDPNLNLRKVHYRLIKDRGLTLVSGSQKTASRRAWGWSGTHVMMVQEQKAAWGCGNGCNAVICCMNLCRLYATCAQQWTAGCRHFARCRFWLFMGPPNTMAVPHWLYVGCMTTVCDLV